MRSVWTAVRRSPWSAILLMVVLSRSLLTLLALYTSAATASFAPEAAGCLTARNAFSAHHWLSVWGNWDTGFYLQLAQQWYPDQVLGPGYPGRPWAFQPLYPGLIHLVAIPLGGRVFLAGVVISNVCLVLSGWLLFRLVKLDGDRATAWRAVTYLLLFPASFLLSAVLTESLFLTLVLAAFYFARTRHWVLACTAVALLGVTRTIGLLVVAPLFLEYLDQRDYRVRRIRADVLAFLIAPIGLAAWSWYARQRTGSALFWQQVQYTQWLHERNANPLTVLWTALTDPSPQMSAVRQQPVALASVGYLVLAAVATVFRWIRPSYLMYTLIVIIVPMTLGNYLWQGMYRFMVVAFPLMIVLAKIGRYRRVDLALTIGLAVFQGMLLSMWTTCWTGLVI